MFRTIVLALLFVELWIPLILGLFWIILDDGWIGCLVFLWIIVVLACLL